MKNEMNDDDFLSELIAQVEMIKLNEGKEEYPDYDDDEEEREFFEKLRACNKPGNSAKLVPACLVCQEDDVRTGVCDFCIDLLVDDFGDVPFLVNKKCSSFKDFHNKIVSENFSIQENPKSLRNAFDVSNKSPSGAAAMEFVGDTYLKTHNLKLMRHFSIDPAQYTIVRQSMDNNRLLGIIAKDMGIRPSWFTTANIPSTAKYWANMFEIFVGYVSVKSNFLYKDKVLFSVGSKFWAPCLASAMNFEMGRNAIIRLAGKLKFKLKIDYVAESGKWAIFFGWSTRYYLYLSADDVYEDFCAGLFTVDSEVKLLNYTEKH